MNDPFWRWIALLTLILMFSIAWDLATIATDLDTIAEFVESTP